MQAHKAAEVLGPDMETAGQENVAAFAMRVLEQKRDPLAEDSEAEILARAVIALERSCSRLMERQASARNALFEIDDIVADRHILDRAACDLIRGAIELSRERN